MQIPIPFGLTAIFVSLFIFYYFNRKKELKRDARRDILSRHREIILTASVQNKSENNNASLREIIESIINKNKSPGIEINKPATINDIKTFEKKIGFSLPSDFVELYNICNGFTCLEDMFNLTPLEEITRHHDDYGKNWFYFSEYMTYSDMWGLRLNTKGQYEIFNGSYPSITMTSSLKEFLSKFLQGNVFDEGGLYDWLEELKNS